MKQFISFVIKEGKHILRDKRTMLILFGMPLVLMLIFGFAITTDVKNVRTVVVTSSMDHLTQQAVDRLAASEYFTITQVVATPREAERVIRSQKADMAIVFGPDFASKRSGVQFIVDGADPNMAQQWTNYATGVMLNADGGAVNTKMLYNPQVKSAYNFVPAIMGMLRMLVCAMMTSISIVREKEKGTMEVLLVSPVKPLMVIVAKAIPYLVLAFVILIIILLMARFVLDVPLVGSLFPADGAVCTGRAAGGLTVLDYCDFHHLHSAGALVGPAHQQCRQDATGSAPALGDGAARAHRDAQRYAVPGGIDATDTAVDIGYHPAPLLHRGAAQAHDYGCQYQGSCP